MKNGVKVFVVFMIILFAVWFIMLAVGVQKLTDRVNLKIISSSENKDLEPLLLKYAKDNNIDLDIEYDGTLGIMDRLNNNENFDAVFMSNSIWLYMLDDASKIKNSKTISINPVIFRNKKIKGRGIRFYK